MYMKEIIKKMSKIKNFKSIKFRNMNKLQEEKKETNTKLNNFNSKEVIKNLCNISDKFEKNTFLSENKLKNLTRFFMTDYSANKYFINSSLDDDFDFIKKKEMQMSYEQINELRNNLLRIKKKRFDNEEHTLHCNQNNQNLVSYVNGKIKIQQEEENYKKQNNTNIDVIQLNLNVIFIF